MTRSRVSLAQTTSLGSRSDNRKSLISKMQLHVWHGRGRTRNHFRDCGFGQWKVVIRGWGATRCSFAVWHRSGGVAQWQFRLKDRLVGRSRAGNVSEVWWCFYVVLVTISGSARFKVRTCSFEPSQWPLCVQAIVANTHRMADRITRLTPSTQNHSCRSSPGSLFMSG